MMDAIIEMWVSFVDLFLVLSFTPGLIEVYYISHSDFLKQVLLVLLVGFTLDVELERCWERPDLDCPVFTELEFVSQLGVPLYPVGSLRP